MEVPIINIGNSKGIILSKTILEEYGFEDKIEIMMEENHIVLKPVTPPRQGWDEAFREMHERGDDELLNGDILDDEGNRLLRVVLDNVHRMGTLIDEEPDGQPSAASNGDLPDSRSWLANSTIRIAVLADRPTRSTRPICV